MSLGRRANSVHKIKSVLVTRKFLTRIVSGAAPARVVRHVEGTPVPVVTNRWFMLLLLFFSRTAMGLQFQTVASVRPFLMDALAIDVPAEPHPLAIRSAGLARGHVSQCVGDGRCARRCCTWISRPPDLPKSGPAHLSLNLTAREWLGSGPWVEVLCGGTLRRDVRRRDDGDDPACW
jgi:hypothetical protein